MPHATVERGDFVGRHHGPGGRLHRAVSIGEQLSTTHLGPLGLGGGGPLLTGGGKPHPQTGFDRAIRGRELPPNWGEFPAVFRPPALSPTPSNSSPWEPWKGLFQIVRKRIRPPVAMLSGRFSVGTIRCPVYSRGILPWRSRGTGRHGEQSLRRWRPQAVDPRNPGAGSCGSGTESWRRVNTSRSGSGPSRSRTGPRGQGSPSESRGTQAGRSRW